MNKYMNSEEVINVRNGIWRRISENVSGESVAALARAVGKAFRRLVVCGRGNDTLSLAPEEEVTNTPIYTGPKIEVPWKGDVFKYPEDRYLTNKETMSQLNILELRFRAQSKILADKKQKIENQLEREERLKRDTMVESMKRSSLKFAELQNLVNDFKKYVAKKRGSHRQSLEGNPQDSTQHF